MSLAAAIETGDLTRLPSRRDEAWRWTDLRGLVRSLPARSPANDDALAPGPFAGLADEEVVIVNGRGPRSLAIAAGGVRTVALRWIAAPDAGAHAARFHVDVAPGAKLILLESYEAQTAEYLLNNELSIEIGEDASLERIVVAGDAAGGISVSHTRIGLAAGSRIGQTVITSGAKRQRIETTLSHPGGGASVRLDGVYLLRDQRHADITTVVVHEGVDGATDQLVKGVVADQGRGVFQGRIVVSPGADRTNARMGHHALLLSDRAEVDAKPELEIYADDVACAHGNTVGALDEEALFYAQARGIDPEEARVLLTGAFVGEVVDRIEHAGARERMAAAVTALLRGDR